MPPIVKTKRRRPVVSVHKPQGVLQPRVRRVGPEHFGIMAIDCAKAHSKWMLCNFFGTMLVPLVFTRRFASPRAVDEVGHAGLATVLHAAAVRFQPATLEHVLAWARTAAPCAPPLRSILSSLNDLERYASGRPAIDCDRKIVTLMEAARLPAVSRGQGASAKGHIPCGNLLLEKRA